MVSVGPGTDARELEVVGIGHLLRGLFLRIAHGEGEAVAGRVGDGVFLGLEIKADLRLHVGRGSPAHQRVDGARRLRLVLQAPASGLGLSGLHGRFRRSEDARHHDASILL